MKLSDNDLSLLDGLNSAYWNIRSKSLEEIKCLEDSELIFEMYKEIERRNDDNLRFQFLVVFEFLLQSNRDDMSGVAICGLVLWKERNNSGVGTKSSQIINDYIHSPNILRYLKIKSIRYAWNRLPRSKRVTLTDVISKNQLWELSSILISNFSIRDEKIWIKTINTLVKFNDRRVIKGVKRVLAREVNNCDLTYSCLIALGSLGSIVDFKLINSYLKNSNVKIQIASVRALALTTGPLAVFKLKTIFTDVYPEKVKLEAISRLGKINNKSSAKALIDLLLQGLDGDLGLSVEWTLHDIDNKVKIPILLRTFWAGSDHDKAKILSFLSDVYDYRLEAFVISVLKSNENELIKIMTINLSSGCSSEVIVGILKSYVMKFDGLLSYTAMIELYEINKLEDVEILEHFFDMKLPLDNLCHQVVLKALSEGMVDKSLHKYVVPYIECIFSSKRIDVVHLALDVATHFPSSELIAEIVKLAEREKVDTITHSARRVAAKIVSLNSEYIPHARPLLNDHEFLMILKGIKLSSEFVDELSLFIQTIGHKQFPLVIKILGSSIESESIRYFSNVINIDSFFELWIECNLQVDKEMLKKLASEFYPKLNEENKRRFLEFMSKYPEHGCHDFFYREVIIREDYLSNLVNCYFENILEVSNE